MNTNSVWDMQAGPLEIWAHSNPGLQQTVIISQPGEGLQCSGLRSVIAAPVCSCLSLMPEVAVTY